MIIGKPRGGCGRHSCCRTFWSTRYFLTTSTKVVLMLKSLTLVKMVAYVLSCGYEAVMLPLYTVPHSMVIGNLEKKVTPETVYFLKSPIKK